MNNNKKKIILIVDDDVDTALKYKKWWNKKMKVEILI